MAPHGSAASKAKPAPHTRTLRLAGPSPTLDHRTHAYRRDLADRTLAADYAAAAYAEPRPMRCHAARAMVRGKPRADAGATSELLYGEPFLALEVGSDWAWGYCGIDRYVGYVPTSALGEASEPTHRVSAPSALVFSQPDVLSPHVAELPLGALLAVTGQDGSFLAIDGGYIHERHVGALRPNGSDWLAVARSFVGTPYLWGGRTRWGIDCSGLVQVALGACGIEAPRDSDMQQQALGHDVDTPAAGDLFFFPGHVGIMADDTNLLHANSHWMGTVIEPLADVVARIAANHATPVLAIKRL